MATNTNAPFGLRPVRKIDGSAPNYQVIKRQILNSNTTKIFNGDCVADDGSGYIKKAVYNDTSHQLYGVFQGCEYYDTALKQKVFSPYWTGSANALAASVFGYVCIDPDMVFEVQSTTATTNLIAISQINNNATFVAAPAGNTANGMSTLVLDADNVATTSTLPFRIVGLSQRVNNDNTLIYNIVEICLNDQTFKTLTGN